MKLVVFSKLFKEYSIDELITLAGDCGFEGYDLCVRPGYSINPENASERLVDAVKEFRKEGLDIPMVTGSGDLLYPEDSTAEPILAAMDEADVRLIKLGYFLFDPLNQDYWQEVDKVRKAFAGWQELGKKYQLKICYHAHSHGRMGLNCSSLAHLMNDFDPKYIGAYIDPGHMVIEGEEFAFGAAVIKRYLSIVGLKDVLKVRTAKDNHGVIDCRWVSAGEGMVDWTAVFSELTRIDYQGPLSVHCELKVPAGQFLKMVKQEVRFFKDKRDRMLKQL